MPTLTIERCGALLGLAMLVGGAAEPGPAASPTYLYGWAGDADGKESDFLSVIDADPASPAYGEVVATTPVGEKGTAPHHVEHELVGRTLYANGWGGARTFLFDLSKPRAPTVVARFGARGRFHYPHSFARLPNGNTLATFQSVGSAYAPPGGLVELDESGQMVRSGASTTPTMPDQVNWPYSLLVLPDADRVVVTSTDMGRGRDWKAPDTSHVQLWSLSTLKPVASINLPQEGATRFHVWPAEPRRTASGAVMVNSFNCGLFHLTDIATATPRARLVHKFDTHGSDHDVCAVPVLVGRYWIQTVGAINGLVVLDLSDPQRPVEVSRITLPKEWMMPHWVAADPSGGRIAVSGMEDSWLAMMTFDPATGQIAIDQRFGKNGAIQFDRSAWPHGASGKAIVHGLVFGPKTR